MKKMRRVLMMALMLMGGLGMMLAQNSVPAPGSNGSVRPGRPGAPGWSNGPNPAPGSGIYNPGPPPPQNWGSPWGGGIGPNPPMIVGTPLSSPNWQNDGTMNVMACGYDAQGVWRTIPLRVQYRYNGAQYKVTVLSAWNPWTDMWNRGVNIPAFNTSYFINGSTFNFYTNLPTGTYYFNL